jgi:hypothetical protein
MKTKQIIALALLLPALAGAAEPTYPQYKAQAKAGLVATTGNARTTTLTAGALLARTDPSNKFQLEGLLAYGRSSLLVARDANANGAIDPGELGRETQTTAESWSVRARYDRFFTQHHGAYAAAVVGADVPAGKDLIGGGQAGYSARLLKTERNELILELGYDFSYEDYAAKGAESVEIHSGRAFVGETVKLNEGVGLSASVEALTNLNEENAVNARDPGAKVEAFDDLRMNGKAALTAALMKNVSLSVGFTVRYDRNPAPLPKVSGLGFGYPAFANEWDTVTDAALIVSFL